MAMLDNRSKKNFGQLKGQEIVIEVRDDLRHYVVRCGADGSLYVSGLRGPAGWMHGEWASPINEPAVAEWALLAFGVLSYLGNAPTDELVDDWDCSISLVYESGVREWLGSDYMQRNGVALVVNRLAEVIRTLRLYPLCSGRLIPLQGDSTEWRSVHSERSYVMAAKSAPQPVILAGSVIACPSGNYQSRRLNTLLKRLLFEESVVIGSNDTIVFLEHCVVDSWSIAEGLTEHIPTAWKSHGDFGSSWVSGKFPFRDPSGLTARRFGGGYSSNVRHIHKSAWKDEERRSESFLNTLEPGRRTAAGLHPLDTTPVRPMPRPVAGLESIGSSKTSWIANYWTESDAAEEKLSAISSTDDVVQTYLLQAGRSVLLDQEQEVELALRIEAGLMAFETLKLVDESGDRRLRHDLMLVVQEGESARRHFIESNLRLVISIAWKYAGKGTELLDLIQEGNLGLVRAVEKYDYAKGFKFSTYATWWIRQAITRGMADRSRAIRLPVHVVEDLLKIERQQREFFIRTGLVAKSSELAALVGIEEAQVKQLVIWGRPVISLETILDEDGATLGEILVDSLENTLQEDFSYAESRQAVWDALDQLPPREANVLALRFGLGDGIEKTLEEVGMLYGLTRERIRQIQNIGLKSLSSILVHNPFN